MEIAAAIALIVWALILLAWYWFADLDAIDDEDEWP